MTDRELLERAARAARAAWYAGFSAQWNPLEDDGDAFRLMVDLNMSVNVHLQDVEADGNDESFGGDPYAATRRAIVRAAAAMVSP